MENQKTEVGRFYHALVAGASAGLAVDVALFPLDTIKTRLQSARGFWKAGGFRGIYSGLPSTVAGSAPTAAAFFVTYEYTKALLHQRLPSDYEPVGHMAAAAFGEVVACLVRVPTEVIKQRAQASPHKTTFRILMKTIQQDGFAGLYRGFTSTVARDVPFAFIQFPVWEFLKKRWSHYQGYTVEPLQSSACGAVAGGVSACLTAPLDVAKTRIMLAESGSVIAKGHIPYALKQVYLEKGIRGLFSGVVPRVTWISLGGAIFLGVYDKAKNILLSLTEKSAQ